MKKLLTHSLVAALTIGLSTVSFAAETKAKKAAAPAPADTTKKPAEKPEAASAEKKAVKPLPMNSRADSIDAAAKTFSMKRKDGVEVKHVVTDKTEIKNGDAAAKFEDIKVGDTVAGSRLKKSDTEYEVVKITKFGPTAPKKAKTEAKPEEKKIEEKKTEEKKP
jgi:hypothetical protein